MPHVTVASPSTVTRRAGHRSGLFPAQLCKALLLDVYQDQVYWPLRTHPPLPYPRPSLLACWFYRSERCRLRFALGWRCIDRFHGKQLHILPLQLGKGSTLCKVNATGFPPPWPVTLAWKSKQLLSRHASTTSGYKTGSATSLHHVATSQALQLLCPGSNGLESHGSGCAARARGWQRGTHGWSRQRRHGNFTGAQASLAIGTLPS